MTDRTGILPQSPLLYTVAAIRFTPWLLLKDKIAEIHDELRELVPLIQHVKIQNNIPELQGESTNQLWILLSNDRKFGLHLASDQFVVFSEQYDRYTDFAEKLDSCLNVLLKYMRHIMDVTYIGIRYIDHIKPKETEKREDYISKQLLAANFPEFEAVGCAYVGSYKSGEYELRVRCISLPDAPAIPEDMISFLAMNSEPGNQIKLNILNNDILLDLDAFINYQISERMRKETILLKLSELHKITNDFFRHDSVCTDHAFKTWKGEID